MGLYYGKLRRCVTPRRRALTFYYKESSISQRQAVKIFLHRLSNSNLSFHLLKSFSTFIFPFTRHTTKQRQVLTRSNKDDAKHYPPIYRRYGFHLFRSTCCSSSTCTRRCSNDGCRRWCFQEGIPRQGH